MNDRHKPIAVHLPDRQFRAEQSNQRGVWNTTEFVSGRSATLCLATTLNRHSRFVVG